MEYVSTKSPSEEVRDEISASSSNNTHSSAFHLHLIPEAAYPSPVEIVQHALCTSTAISRNLEAHARELTASLTPKNSTSRFLIR